MNISTPVTAFDDAKAAAFADRLVGTLGEASLALMMSLGHRARLFDTLAAIPPATSERIAAKAGLICSFSRRFISIRSTVSKRPFSASAMRARRGLGAVEQS